MMDREATRRWMQEHAAEHVGADGACDIEALKVHARRALSITSHGLTTLILLDDIATNAAVHAEIVQGKALLR